MKHYSYRILSFDDVTERRAHRKEFLLRAEIVPTEKKHSSVEKSAITQIMITVSCSESQITSWAAQDRNPELAEPENLYKVLHEYGRQYLEEKLREGETAGSFELRLFWKGPEPCRFNPAVIEIDHIRWYDVEVSRPIGFRIQQ